MGCIFCFSSKQGIEKLVNDDLGRDTKSQGNRDHQCAVVTEKEKQLVKIQSDKVKPAPTVDGQLGAAASLLTDGTATIAAQTFTFRQLAAATKNFRPESLLGEGGFGRVYKGRLEPSGQVVAVKQLDRNGLQGNREFLVEALMLSLLHHPNLVNLIGYCADGDQRLLVYEFMPLGCLEDHLHDIPSEKEPLDWNTRMKIAAGAARGLEYLHDKANPPVIYRDFKSSNILLDEGFHPKLSDFGLAKLGPVGDKTHVSTRVMGTYGYCAPEYAMTGQLTLKSDVYSFGVVLLELITGRKAIDNSRAAGEHNLVAWARPLFKDRRRFPSMADTSLQGRYPMRALYQALAVAAMCLQEQAAARPLIGDVVTALNYLACRTYDPPGYTTKDKSKERRPNSVSTAAASAAADVNDEVQAVHSPTTTATTTATTSSSPEARYTSTTQHHHHSSNNKESDVSSTTADDGETSTATAATVATASSGKRENDEWDRYDRNSMSPGRTNRIFKEGFKAMDRDRDRERALAEAKIWGENYRERKRGNLQVVATSSSSSSAAATAATTATDDGGGFG